MYPLNPDRIYAHTALRPNPDAMTRLHRFLAAMGRAETDVEWFAPDDAIRVSSELAAWNPDKAEPGWKMRQPVVFTRFVTDGSTFAADPVSKSLPEGVPLHQLSLVLGYMAPFILNHSRESDAKSGTVCWPSKFLSTVAGCSHGCVYCGSGRDGKALIVNLNVLEYLDKVFRKVIDDTPWQRCFLMIGMGADMATLEPEYGLYEDFLNFLSQYEDRYVYFHTNGDNVDWIENLTHKERLIGVWSLCSNEAAELLEPCAPSATSRIAAMARLEEWGVPYRVKLKPILPVRNWRESYANLLRELLTSRKPETLGFASVMWTPFERFERIVDLDLLDPTFVEAGRAAKEAMKDNRHAPFPHGKRAELYRFMIQESRKHAPKLPLFISTESTEMWDELADEIGQSARFFLCGCNPVQGPGPRYLKSDIKESNYRNNKELAAGGG